MGYNSVPALDTRGINIIPGLQAGQQMRDRNQLNFLRAQRERDRVEDRGIAMENAIAEKQARLEDRTAEKLKRNAEIYSKIASAPTKKDAEALAKIYGHKVSWRGPNITIRDKSGAEITGPSTTVYEIASNLAKNPEYAKDERTWRYAAANGVSIKQAKEKTPVMETLTIYGPNGETKRISVEKGKGYTPPQKWSLTKPASKETETAKLSEWRMMDKRLEDDFYEKGAMGAMLGIGENAKDAYKLAQRKFVELRKDSEDTGIKPDEARIKARDFVKHVVDRYWKYLEKAKDEETKEAARKEFKRKYGWEPKRKIR